MHPETPSDFGRWAITWLVGAVVVFVLGPPLMVSIWTLPDNFPVGARLSLVIAWLVAGLLVIALVNLWRIFAGVPPVNVTVPPGLTGLLRAAALGAVALEAGYIIGTTIFR